MNNREYLQLTFTMVVGGLIYSILSFAYISSNFVPTKRVDRLEHRLDKKLDRIENKIDKLMRDN